MTISIDIRAAMSPALLRRGCVNVIGLDSIRSRIGAERWEKMREHIYTRIEALLHGKLGPTDFFMRLTEEAYLVTTPSFENGEAALCCLKVAQELHNGLFGRCTIGDLSLSRMTGDKAEALALARIEGVELASLAVKAGMEDNAVRAILAERPHVPAADPPTEMSPRAAAKGKLQFTPVWDLRKEAITSYRLCLAPQRAPGQVTAAEFRLQVAQFLNGLRYAASTVMSSLKTGSQFLMIVPVHFDMLSSPIGRMEIVSACRGLSSDIRPLLMFEIFDVPSGVPQSRMCELVSAVRPFLRGVAACYAPGFYEYQSHQIGGLHTIGLTTPYGTPPKLLREQLEKLTAAAKRQGVGSFLAGIRSLDTVDIARAAGIDILLGRAIRPDVDAPSGMSRLSWSGFMDRREEAMAV